MAGFEYKAPTSVKLTSGSNNDSLGSINAPIYMQPYEYGKSAFGQFRVSEPYTLADFTNYYEINPYVFETSSVGSANVSHDNSQSTVFLSASGNSGDEAIISTISNYRYQAGKGMNIILTGYSQDSGNDNQMKRWGFFDSEDGLFFMLSGSQLGVCKRTSVTGSVVDTFVPQTSWSVDTMNGSGMSRCNIDVTKGNIYEIRIQWLGVGVVDFFINEILVHQMIHPNTYAGPYMKTANLPVRFEIKNDGVSIPSQMAFICGTVLSDGGTDPPSIVHTAYTTSSVSVSTTDKAVLAIRPSQLYPSGSGIYNRAQIHPIKAVITTIDARAEYKIIADATIDGVFEQVEAESHVEFCQNISSYSGGDVIYDGYLPNSNTSDDIELDFAYGLNKRSLRVSSLMKKAESLVIVAKKTLGGTTGIQAAISFEEHF